MRGAVEMRFKVGDRVRVLNDLEVDKMYGGDDVTTEMAEKCGHIAIISIVSSNHYNLDIDGGEWCWTDEMLEEVVEMEDKKYIKFDIPEWVNWLARDINGDLYGYRNKPNKGSVSWCIGQVYVEQTNCYLVSTDPNHYPQVKWEDEEPSKYKDGITVIDFGNDGLLDFHTNEAITALQSFGRYSDERVNEPIEAGGTPMKKYERHSEITKQLNEIYIAKNTDYGDAFGDTFKKLGIISAVTRIVDKTNRLMSLSAKTEAERNVKDETIKDTLMDLANYALMTLIEMEELE